MTRFAIVLFLAALTGCTASPPDPATVQAAFASCMGDDVSAGLSALDGALDAHPEWPDALAARGLCRWTRFAADSSRADLDAAHADLTSAIASFERWDTSTSAFSLDGLHSHRAFIAQARSPETWGPALDDFDAAVQIAPQDISHRFDRGLARAYAGDSTGARDDLDLFLTESDSSDVDRRTHAEEVLRHMEEPNATTVS